MTPCHSSKSVPDAFSHVPLVTLNVRLARKNDLISLAKDLGEDPDPTFQKLQLINLIQSNTNYNEDDAKIMLEAIVEEVELEKLRLTAASTASPRHEKSSCYELTKVMPSFDPKNGDITLFLSLFERQAKRVQIDARDWVSGLLMLLPSDNVQLIARESEENFDNYSYIKSVLLKRFKLSPEEFRKKFLHHQKSPEKPYGISLSKFRIIFKNGSMDLSPSAFRNCKF
ncbi:unnamed protein product [Larinioides sclopetarius]|uniref:Uncharacterized protein n=1 Tax=Larinioides sclopetarius TaxID=280406 RepID=A0AAV2A169_9ARAC